MEIKTWMNVFLQEDLKNGLRVGQSYLNHVEPQTYDAKLYYETDEYKCWQMIWERN